MKSIVIYASRFGNTEKVAMAIAAGLRTKGPVDVYEVADAPTSIPTDVDLVLIGGPTEGRAMTRPIANYLECLTDGSLEKVRAAAFDTRVRWPRWLSGSAGLDIAARLTACGASLVTPVNSFFVFHNVTELEPGEIERAERWGRSVGEKVKAGSRVGTFA